MKLSGQNVGDPLDCEGSVDVPVSAGVAYAITEGAAGTADLANYTSSQSDDGSGAGEVVMSGTHTGPLATPTGGEVPPTNKRIEVKGAAFVRLNGSGEIVEERRYYDVGTLLRQLGLMPEQAEEPAGARR